LIVALMTQQLRPGPASRVLDVGTGSGYQTAILAELAGEVVTVEVVEPLAGSAQQVLEDLGYRNVVFRTGDARFAAADLAPFDRILVAAAAPEIPNELVDQLAPGGRMVIPVGAWRDHQELLLVEKDRGGQVRRNVLFPVSFVPLT
jgi:protein-L-isoaspartate(D-aspartate) O-methyltransferase